MKKIFKRKKKTLSDAGSLKSNQSASGYNISPKKDLQKVHKAAFENDISKLKTILKKGDVNQLDKENRTPLHIACAQGNCDAVRVLVSHAACNLNLCDNDKRSALMKCVQCQFQDCLEILINKCANVNLSDENGNTALHLAAAIPSIDACCLLLDSNAEVNHKNKEGSTPLHIASSTEGSEELISNLIEDGASINVLDNSGKTPLMLAASRGYLEIVRLLLYNKADASIKDSRGWSADDYASMSGHHPISMIIFEHSQTHQKKETHHSSMGDHVYATINRTHKGNSSKNKDSIKCLNFTEEDISLSEVSSSSLHVSDPDCKPEETKTAVVNVAAFVKQRQMMKNNSLESKDIGDSVGLTLSKNLSTNVNEKRKIANVDINLHLPDCDNNSKKNHLVSPCKLPLPSHQSNNSTSVTKNINFNRDDSSWDNSANEVQNAKHTNTHANHRDKLNSDMTKNIHLSGDINHESCDSILDSSSTNHKKLYMSNNDEPVEMVGSENESISSAWDDDNVSEKSLLKEHLKFITSSSLLKFDDELSENTATPAIPKQSLSLNGVLCNSHDDDNDDMVNSAKIDASSINPALSDENNNSFESESEWERENRHRRQMLGKANSPNDMKQVSGSEPLDDETVSVATKKKHQKVLALEAVAAVKLKAVNKQKENEVMMEMEEKHLEILGSQDKLKIEAALQEALNVSGDPSDSEVSEPSPLENIQYYTQKTGANHNLLSQHLDDDLKVKFPESEKNCSRINGIDPDKWTSSDETDTELQEDLIGAIPASLRSSQLSDLLIRSSEHGELEREVAKEKRKAIDAIEELEFARRNIEVLHEQVRSYKNAEEGWNIEKNELEAEMRKLNFEQNQLNEQLASSELNFKSCKERLSLLEGNLDIESDMRRKQEITIRELQNELKVSEQHLKKLENANLELLNKHQEIFIEDQVERDRLLVKHDIVEESSQARQSAALNVLLQEKEDELIKIKSERDAMKESLERYKQELNTFHSKGDDKLSLFGKLNEELNEKVQELTCCVKEKEEFLQQTLVQHAMQIDLFKQANEAVTSQIKREQVEKETVLHDLEALNEQQRILKVQIDDNENKLRKEENKCALFEGQIKEIREQKEALEKRLHDYEMNESSALQETHKLRMALTHKESILGQIQRENQETKEKLKNLEIDLNDSRRDNAKNLGRIEMLQADISQQESERIRLRRELDEARNINSTALNNQQGKLSEIMTANQAERIELEKLNAQLNEQITHLKEEISKLSDEKVKKEEELGWAHQDRIDIFMKLGFTKSSITELTDAKEQLEVDKEKMIHELNDIKNHCSSLENKIEIDHQQISSLREQLTNEQQAADKLRANICDLEKGQSEERKRSDELEDKVKDAEIELTRLQSLLSSYAVHQKNGEDEKEIMIKSKMKLEELVANLQDEKIAFEEKWKSAIQRCQLLENEACGHQKMWQEEVKARSKLSVEFAKVDQERKEACNLLDALKNKYSTSSTEERFYKKKYEYEKKCRAKTEKQLDKYSKMLAESRVQYDTSESECETKLSRLSDKHETEKSRLESMIQDLKSRLISLDKIMKKERDGRICAENELNRRKNAAENDNSSLADLNKERDELRFELERLKCRIPGEVETRAMVNAEVNCKLEQVNAWLEERAVAQDILEKLRFDNEEKRVAEANQKAEQLLLELNNLKKKLASKEDENLRNILQQLKKDKTDLRGQLNKSQFEVEELKQKLEHEKRKYEQLQSSAISGAISDPSVRIPHLSASLPNQSSLQILSSTPHKAINQPMLNLLRQKLDANIAMKLNILTPDETNSSRNKPNLSGSSEYFSP